jgi:hypothetical protein
MKRLLAILLITASFTLSAQTGVGINTATPEASSALDISSTSKGLLIPRMTEVQRTGINPSESANGLLVYQTDGTSGFYYYNGMKWNRLEGVQGPQGTPGLDGIDGAAGGLNGAAGADGTNGTDGAAGIDGTNGADGASAYQLAVTNGFTGTEAAWLTAIEGVPGADGVDGIDGAVGPTGLTGADGIDGTNGSDGASAYQLAVTNGFAGTEAAWLTSIEGAPGEDTLNLMTAAGDILYGGAGGAVTVLAAGAAGQVLTMNADATSLEWVEIQDIIDVDVPLEVAITSSALTNNQQPTIEGTTEAGATITVSIDDFSITVTQDGTTWSATPADGELVDLTQGTHMVKVVATGTAGSTATVTQSLYVDLSPPAVLIDDNDDDDANDGAATTNDVTVSITGVTDVAIGQIVTITLNLLGTAGDVINTAVFQAVVQVDGIWNVIPILSEGVWSILAEVTDEVGNTGSSTQVLTVDVYAPAVAITSGTLTDDSTPTITGTTEVGATIAVSINGLPVSVTVDGTGWSATPGIALVAGDYTIAVTATDAVGNTATASQVLTVDTAAPVVTIVDVGVTNDPRPEITLTTEAGATVTAVIGDVDVPVTRDSTDSTAWSATPMSDLGDGDYTITVTATDALGNAATYSMSFTVDRTAPDVLIDDNDDNEPNDAAARTSDVTPAITGVTDAGAGQNVRVILGLLDTAGQVTQTAVAQAVVQVDGTWNVIPLLYEGVWSVEAAVTDAAGNVGKFTQLLTVDTTAPALTVTSSFLTNDETPTITGTTEGGVAIAVSINGLAVNGSASTGTAWSATPTVGLADGTHNVLVTAIDAVGNTATVTQTLTVDTTSPALTVVHVGVTNDLTPQITGTTEAGATIAVDIEGNGAVFDVVLNGTAWSATPTGNLEEDDYQFTVTSTDLAGNSRTLTANFTIDQTPPEVTLDGGSPHTTADATPIISGSAVGVEVGSKVTVELAGDSGSPIADLITEIDVGGVFEVTAATIANGDYTVTVTVTDDAGNTGDANQSLTVYAVAPAVTYTEGSVASTNDSTPLISGTTNAVVGSAVAVTIGGQSLETTVQFDATWNVTATNLENDDYVVDVQVTDLDGNVGTASQVLTVDTAAPVVTIDAVGVTNDPRPEITFRTEAGATVTAVILGVDVGGTQDSTDNTAWSATPMSDFVDGVYTITVTATDGAGNEAAYSMSFTVDRTAPDVLIDDNYDDAPNDAAARTSDVTPAITGVTNASAGQIVTVILGLLDTAGQVIHTGVAQAVVQVDGTWNVIPILSEGVWSVEAAVTDEAGNIGSSTQTLTVDLTAPAVEITSSDVTNDDTPTIIGTTEVGAAISVSINGSAVSVTVDGTGWSATPGIALVDGDYTIAVTATDAVGNTATASQVLTVDTAAP